MHRTHISLTLLPPQKKALVEPCCSPGLGRARELGPVWWWWCRWWWGLLHAGWVWRHWRSSGLRCRCAVWLYRAGGVTGCAVGGRAEHLLPGPAGLHPLPPLRWGGWFHALPGARWQVGVCGGVRGPTAGKIMGGGGVQGERVRGCTPWRTLLLKLAALARACSGACVRARLREACSAVISIAYNLSISYPL